MQQGQNWEEIPKEEGRPVDVVLEGGEVKGTGLVGAISVLEEEGYRFQNLAGTSAGAIVATLLGAGYTADELHRILLEAPPIGWQLSVLGYSQSDSIAFSAFLDIYATHLLAEALRTRLRDVQG